MDPKRVFEDALQLPPEALAALAAELAHGYSLKEAALHLGVSRFTVRCQLSAVFAKTNCHRQPEVISMICAAVQSMWPDLPPSSVSVAAG